MSKATEKGLRTFLPEFFQRSRYDDEQGVRVDRGHPLAKQQQTIFEACVAAKWSATSTKSQQALRVQLIGVKKKLGLETDQLHSRVQAASCLSSEVQSQVKNETQESKDSASLRLAGRQKTRTTQTPAEWSFWTACLC